MKIKILLAGGSGLIGQRLVEYLNFEKYEFNILSRSARKSAHNIKYFLWDTQKQEIDPEALEGVKIIINLAGAGIADKRWTSSRKEILLNSRINSVKTIKKHVEQFDKKPIYIGASAIGYYGDQGEKLLTEADNVGKGFLAEITDAWEKEQALLANYVDRSVLLRIGIVLSKKGGALKEILKPAMLGVFGYFGNGKAMYPWIHIDDVCEIIRMAINNSEYKGILNTTSPNPTSIKSLVKKLKETMPGTGLVLPVPEFMLKLVLGEMKTMLTNSANAIPQNLINLNHEFLYPQLGPALEHILKSKV